MQVKLKFQDGMLNIKDENMNIYFTTAENNINYKFDTIEGVNNLYKLQKKFDLNNVLYLNQIHSNMVLNGDEKIFKGDIEGDSIVCSKSKMAIGVFTADCVPIMIYDKSKNVIAAVHSGWKGTFGNIVGETINVMKAKYGCDDIKAIIGPHIRQCCYQVSNELIDKFSGTYNKTYIKGERNLNMEKYIKNQLVDYIKEENITTLNLCTFCSERPEFYSFRKKGKEAGRMFSFIFMN